jgi:hypothetical protein
MRNPFTSGLIDQLRLPRTGDFKRTRKTRPNPHPHLPLLAKYEKALL